jgi:hypothetical protein
MFKVAQKLLTEVDRIGKLLDRDFRITKTGLQQAIDAVIAAEITRHKLNVRSLDTRLVDWPALIDRSISRAPPFEEGIAGYPPPKSRR